MNENTLISIHGYAGDAHQIRFMLPYYLHHKCPVVILSPEDAPITAALVTKNPTVSYIIAGQRAYVGQTSLDRQIKHLQALLKFPHRFFLMNDADSVCLSPKIPEYVYAEPEVLWSNEIPDTMHHRPDPAYSWPRIAFQPPYFCSREVIERLLSVADMIKADPTTPFIDWCMMAWCVGARTPHKTFRDGISCPSTTVETRYAMEGGIHNGAVFVHSIKQLEALKQMAWARVRYKKKHGIK